MESESADKDSIESEHSYSLRKQPHSEPTGTQLVTDGGTNIAEAPSTDPRQKTRSVPDPETGHPQNLLGRQLRIDWGARVDVGEIRHVSYDVERGTEIRLGIPNGDGGWSRMVTFDPSDHDVTMLGGDE